jgi:hypothetical protein
MAIVKEQQDVRRMNDALLSALQGMPRIGRIRESNTLGWDLRFARQVKLGDGWTTTAHRHRSPDSPLGGP